MRWTTQYVYDSEGELVWAEVIEVTDEKLRQLTICSGMFHYWVSEYATLGVKVGEA